MANWEHVPRKYTKIERPNPNTVIATYECGHVSNELNPIMQFELSLKYGEYGHCFQCAKQEYEQKLKEGK